MQQIILIRHGQASFGEKNYDQLSKIGLQQAACLGEFLSPMLNADASVRRGTMYRHQQTAETALASHALQSAITTHADWNEFNHQQVFERYDARYANPAELIQDIQATSNPSQTLQHTFSAAMQRWMDPRFADDYDENWQSFKQRIDQALAQLQQDLQHSGHSQALVFSSGGVISTILCQLLQLPMSRMPELMFEVGNCSLSTIKLEAAQLKLQSFNEHHYLHSKTANLITVI